MTEGLDLFPNVNKEQGRLPAPGEHDVPGSMGPETREYSHKQHAKKESAHAQVSCCNLDVGLCSEFQCF
jgi:hypothetical protein